MGGRAFANHDPPLPTPRLSPDEYRQIRDVLVTKLREHFGRVAVPIEGPGKTSFGDVDINISEPKSGRAIRERPVMNHLDNVPLSEANERLFSTQVTLLENILQPAARMGASFALPKAPLLGHTTESEPAYVQVDITVLPPDRLPWHYFMHCHGDTWNMLSPSLRSVGLVVTDVGLCLINPVIAQMDRKRSRLQLTSDPDTVLEFLGLSPAVFWGQDARLRSVAADGSVPELFGEREGPLAGRCFTTETEHFAFLCSSRFFDKAAYKTTGLKSHERRRLEIRPAYGRFVRDFVPQANNQGACPSYARTLYEALERFGKREEYNEQDQVWRAEQEELDQKQFARRMRKQKAEQDIGYADAWLSYLEERD